MNREPTVLGFDIGGTQVRAAVARGGEVLAMQAARWPVGRSPEDEVLFAADLGQDLARQAGLSDQLSAAGVALAALVDGGGTVVQWPNRPSWRGLAFTPLLSARLGLPVTVEDDANAAALAEWRAGAGQSYRHVLVIMAGTGIGAGLILDGRLFRGRSGWAGELGHVVVVPNGLLCACGKRGCLQTVASGRALERAAARRDLPSAEALTAAADEGEAWAHEELATCGRWIGLAAANVVNLLDLEAVVVGGGLSSLGDSLWLALEAGLREHLLNGAHRQVALLRAQLPDTAGLLGAVMLAGDDRRRTTDDGRPTMDD